MISGRCSLLSPARYVSELFKRQYCRDHGKVTSLIVGVSPIRGLQLNRSDKRRPAIIFLSMRMASTSSGTDATNDDTSSEKNRLALEKSPYLLQHAHNPVQWYPWGQEAFDKARKENKLIFLSVGYSTCHWCHVMERESFENPEIAGIMNKFFVNVKVDREERPDIDRIYMNFIQSLSGHGGWPMSVFLLPDLTPITGGTYFPPEDKYGQPGFKKILLSVAGKWKINQADILATGSGILKVLKRVAEVKSDSDHVLPPEECGRICLHQLTQAYEPQYGGFSDAPKFPQTANFNFLFHMYARNPKKQYNKQCLEMCVHTLRMIAQGGIHDHVGQGFSRYSVDSEWHVPHFEKMLYDQAMLMQSYADAYVATKDSLFAEVIDDIATYVTRDLRHKDGGFYSAEDADSYPTTDATHKKEGAFYVWTYDEIKSLLSKDLPDKNIKMFDLFCYHFTVEPQGNVTKNKDPHNELTGKNVLIMRGSIEQTAEHFGIPVDGTKAYLQDACKILFNERSKRPRPHLDDKIITAWNGLMISGLARATSATNNDKYARYATETAKFIEQYLYDNDEGVLLRSCYRDEKDNIVQPSVPIHGFHVDYAYVVKGLLDLYEATFDTHWIEFAEKLQNIQNDLFWDKEHHGYYATTTDDDAVIIRFKEDHDGVEPSSNSVACGNLLRLAAYLDHSEYHDMAGKLLDSFKSQMARMPVMLPEMVAAQLHFHDCTTQIYIVGELGSKDTEDLIHAVRGRLIPGKAVTLIDPRQPADILLRNRVVSKMKSQNGVSTAYVCRHHSCSLPVTNADELIVLLDERLE